jgi:predicted  nucleic acid-binding Zn-ribbon protein
MNDINTNLAERLAYHLLSDILTSKKTKVIYFDGKYYCMSCFSKNSKITTLRAVRDEEYVFNCPYCSELKKYDPTEHNP